MCSTNVRMYAPNLVCVVSFIYYNSVFIETLTLEGLTYHLLVPLSHYVSFQTFSVFIALVHL